MVIKKTRIIVRIGFCSFFHLLAYSTAVTISVKYMIQSSSWTCRLVHFEIDWWKPRKNDIGSRHVQRLFPFSMIFDSSLWSHLYKRGKQVRFFFFSSFQPFNLCYFNPLFIPLPFLLIFSFIFFFLIRYNLHLSYYMSFDMMMCQVLGTKWFERVSHK